MLLKNGRTSSPDKPQNCNIHHVLRKMGDFVDMGQYFQIFKKGPSKICGRKLLKNLKWYGLSRPFFKGCLPRILLDPFLNTLFHMSAYRTETGRVTEVKDEIFGGHYYCISTSLFQKKNWIYKDDFITQYHTIYNFSFLKLNLHIIF